MRSISKKILGLIGIVAAGAAIALAFALVALSGIEGMGHRVSRQNDIALATELEKLKLDVVKDVQQS